MLVKKIFTKKIALQFLDIPLDFNSLIVYVFKKTDGLMQELTNITRELNK